MSLEGYTVKESYMNPQGKNSSAGNELMSQNLQNIAGKAIHHSPQQVHRIVHCPQELQTDQNVKHQRINIYIIKSIKERIENSQKCKTQE